jgi:hypothetical protein
MSRFNSVPIVIQQMVESVQSKSTPEHVRFNQVQMLETIRDYCDHIVADWRKEQDKQQLFKKRK